MISRRQFLKSTTIATLSIPMLPGCMNLIPKSDKIGLQLYTVRDKISKDLAGTLKEVARIGYSYLEAAGYSDGKFYGLPPREFRSMVEDLGMKLISSHVAFTPEQASQVIDSHLELGVPYVVFPWMSMPDQPTRDDYARKAELFNKLGDLCDRSGLKFGYHNHAFEFIKIENSTRYDILMELCDPELVFFEADIYWMTFANVDPLEYLKKYKGRYKIWHVKDMENSPEKSFAIVGEGTINYGEIFNKMNKISGMEYFFVEQDSCKKDSLESIAISYNNLREIL